MQNEQADSKCFCLLVTGANALVLPRKGGMTGTEAQCTVPGGNVVSGTVIQVLKLAGEDYHVVAIDGASPLMPENLVPLVTSRTLCCVISAVNSTHIKGTAQDCQSVPRSISRCPLS